jgi:16S rRNA (uracil1498-N3)-methyltransferase
MGGRRGRRDGPSPSHDASSRRPDEPEQVLYLDAPSAAGRRVRIEGSEAGHALNSLRLRSGDAVALVDGCGKRYHGHIAALDRHGLDVQLEREEPLAQWPSRAIWLGAGVLRSTRMDTVIEKASELGAERFVPLLLKRCVARPHEDGAKQERWHRIAIESLKQSKRARLLDVAPPAELDTFLSALPAGRTLWAADPSGEDPAEAARPMPADPLILVVGPEGGLAPEEEGMLERAGARFVRLGGHRLRAETASQTLLATALTVLGELGPARNGV